MPFCKGITLTLGKEINNVAVIRHFSDSADVWKRIGFPSAHRRHIDAQSGHALEILSHSIEYLIDEYMHEDGMFSMNSGPMQAVQLLMQRNLQIYCQCPKAPAAFERCRAILNHLGFSAISTWLFGACSLEAQDKNTVGRQVRN
jgi:hypothetical protein